MVQTRRLWAAVSLAIAFAGCSGGGNTTPPPPRSCTGTGDVVCGTVTYDFVPSVYIPSTEAGGLDFAHATRKPVRNGTVLVMQGATVLASTSTDETGWYNVAFTPGPTGTLSVVALAETSDPVIVVQDNTDSDAEWAISGEIATGKTVKNLYAAHGWTGSAYDAGARAAAPFAILDTMYTAAHAFLDVRAVTYPDLHVNWSPDNVPESGSLAAGQIGTSHFNPAFNEIFILGKDGVDTDEFDKEVIAHEWGHFFEHNLSRSDSPGGPHSDGDVLDPRVAFGEGYGDAVASMVLKDPIYSDTFWYGSALVGFGWDAEHEPAGYSDPVPGVFSETKVTRLLYDLFDPANESFDQVALGLGPICDVLTGPEKTTDALTTIGSFIAGLKAQPGVNAAKVDALLAKYDIGPITTQWGGGDDYLAAMYPAATSFPATWSNVEFDGRYDYNKWYQVQYFVFTGNGAQVTASASSIGDVGIQVYRAGEVVASSDQYYGNATESASFTTVNGAKHVLVVTGWEATNGTYSVSVGLTSP